MSARHPTTPLKLLLYPLLLGMMAGVGFFVGRAVTTEAPQPAVSRTSSSGAEESGGAGRATGAPEPQGGALSEEALRVDLDPGELHTIQLFQEAAPSVVYITSIVQRRDFFTLAPTRIPAGTGSGFVWDGEGHVVTNYHVIANAQEAQVTIADGTTWNARLVGAAPEKDLAVLRIDAPATSLIPARRGRSHNLLVGQTVLAIGNPFGLDQTLTTGIISALGREIDSAAEIPIRDVIQTDAAINPGNSGGPLLDSSGLLIGVNTAIFSPSGAYAGIGFAIPVDTVEWVVADLIEFGRVVRPDLGVSFLHDQVARRNRIEGVVILEVDPRSGAADAGLRGLSRNSRGDVVLGDVIVAIDGEEVASSGDIQLILETREVGQVVVLTYVRDGQRRDARVQLRSSTE